MKGKQFIKDILYIYIYISFLLLEGESTWVQKRPVVHHILAGTCCVCWTLPWCRTVPSRSTLPWMCWARFLGWARQTWGMFSFLLFRSKPSRRLWWPTAGTSRKWCSSKGSPLPRKLCSYSISQSASTPTLVHLIRFALLPTTSPLLLPSKVVKQCNWAVWSHSPSCQCPNSMITMTHQSQGQQREQKQTLKHDSGCFLPPFSAFDAHIFCNENIFPLVETSPFIFSAWRSYLYTDIVGCDRTIKERCENAHRYLGSLPEGHELEEYRPLHCLWCGPEQAGPLGIERHVRLVGLVLWRTSELLVVFDHWVYDVRSVGFVFGLDRHTEFALAAMEMNLTGNGTIYYCGIVEEKFADITSKLQSACYEKWDASEEAPPRTRPAAAADSQSGSAQVPSLQVSRLQHQLEQTSVARGSFSALCWWPRVGSPENLEGQVWDGIWPSIATANGNHLPRGWLLRFLFRWRMSARHWPRDWLGSSSCDKFVNRQAWISIRNASQVINLLCCGYFTQIIIKFFAYIGDLLLVIVIKLATGL